MDLSINGRVILVTGASRGLGRAIAVALAAEGATVLAAMRSPVSLPATDEHPGRVVPIALDVNDRDRFGEVVDDLLDRFGRLDGLVNNAGIAPASPFAQEPMSTWEETLSVNVLGPAALTQAVGAHFLQVGAGKVVNIASLSGLRGKPGLTAYSASKGALLRLTEAIAAEWARHGIQVNAIAPGGFATDAQAAVTGDEAILARRLRKIPTGRLGHPEEIGPLACYLLSPLSDFVTGATFVIDGGELAKL